jgi:pimeloyl-ACP methyl ester carboxylesterase
VLALLGALAGASAQAAAVKLTRARIEHSRLEADAPNAFTFRLNHRARVRIVLRRGKRRVGVLRGTRGRGAGRVAFGGRVRGHPLRAGRYVAMLSAGGSHVSRVRFRIIRSPSGAGCPGSSWFAGTTDICSGVLHYRDYVYDDYGADTGAALTKSTGDLSPSAGDQAYPVGQANTADLVALKLWAAGGRLHISALVNTLFNSSSTIVAVALDTRGGASPGGKWPGLDVSSSGWNHVYELRRGDPATNTFTASEPLPAGARWRVQAVTAQANGTVMNVAFRGPNEQARFGGTAINNASSLSDVGSWFEDQQAAALRSGDISRFGYTVNVADLEQAASLTMPAGPGLHERVYTSAYTLAPGEGINFSGVPGRGNGGSGAVKAGFEQVWHYLGRYQPYGIYIPPGAPPYGLQMYYHGTGANFTSQINQAGMQARFGDALHRILAAPLARGPDGYSSDISERDELDVLADVQSHFGIDRSQVFASGYSQGGYIAYYMAEQYPQLFAGVVAWVGFTGDELNGTPVKDTPGLSYTAGAVGNVLDFVPSLLNIPTSMLYSGQDELVHDQTSAGMDRAFASTPNIFNWYFHPAGEHLTYIVLDDWRKEAADTRGLRLVSDPVHVRFVRDPDTDSPSYGIRHDTAYWASGITDRTAGVYGQVDLTNDGCGGTVPRTVAGQSSGTDPIPWVSDYRHQVATTTVPATRRLTGSLTNVSSVRIDAAATCLKGGPVSYSITTDGPATVDFTDGRTLTLTGSGHHAGTLR